MNTRNLLPIFIIMCVLCLIMVWQLWPTSFITIGLMMSAWIVLGLIGGIAEIALIPNDQSVPKKLRIAGRVLRYTLAIAAFMLFGSMLFLSFY